MNSSGVFVYTQLDGFAPPCFAEELTLQPIQSLFAHNGYSGTEDGLKSFDYHRKTIQLNQSFRQKTYVQLAGFSCPIQEQVALRFPCLVAFSAPECKPTACVVCVRSDSKTAMGVEGEAVGETGANNVTEAEATALTTESSMGNKLALIPTSTTAPDHEFEQTVIVPSSATIRLVPSSTKPLSALLPKRRLPTNRKMKNHLKKILPTVQSIYVTTSAGPARTWTDVQAEAKLAAMKADAEAAEATAEAKAEAEAATAAKAEAEAATAEAEAAAAAKAEAEAAAAKAEAEAAAAAKAEAEAATQAESEAAAKAEVEEAAAKAEAEVAAAKARVEAAAKDEVEEAAAKAEAEAAAAEAKAEVEEAAKAEAKAAAKTGAEAAAKAEAEAAAAKAEAEAEAAKTEAEAAAAAKAEAEAAAKDEAEAAKAEAAKAEAEAASMIEAEAAAAKTEAAAAAKAKAEAEAAAKTKAEAAAKTEVVQALMRAKSRAEAVDFDLASDVPKACGDYRLDMAGDSFGVCLCGFSRPAHASSSTTTAASLSSLSFSKFGTTGAKFGENKKVFGRLANHDEQHVSCTSASTSTSSRACGFFKLDVAAATFGACSCGFSKADHETQACRHYQLDMTGASFGVCKCGFSRAEHRSTAMPHKKKRTSETQARQMFEPVSHHA